MMYIFLLLIVQILINFSVLQKILNRWPVFLFNRFLKNYVFSATKMNCIGGSKVSSYLVSIMHEFYMHMLCLTAFYSLWMLFSNILEYFIIIRNGYSCTTIANLLFASVNQYLGSKPVTSTVNQFIPIIYSDLIIKQGTFLNYCSILIF